MARPGGFLNAIERLAREQARQQRLAEAARKRQQRELIQQQRERQRQKAQQDKAEHQRYLAARAEDAEAMTAELRATTDALQTILETSLKSDHSIAFSSLRLKEEVHPLRPPLELTVPKAPPRKEDYLRSVKSQSFLEKLFGLKARYLRELQEAENRFAQAGKEYRHAEGERVKKFEKLQADYEAGSEKRLTEIRDRNNEIDELLRGYESGEPGTVEAYCSMVLQRSPYPDSFPQQYRLAFVPDSKQLVINYELPGSAIVPGVQEYRYVKTKDTIEEKPRKPADIKELYQEVIAAITLRTLHELLQADQGNHIAVLVFNGFVNAVDPATGKDIRPCLISVRAKRAVLGNRSESR